MGNLKVLATKPDAAAEEVMRRFNESAASVNSWKGLAGYALVVWDRSGNMGQAALVAETSPYSRQVMPAIVAEALRDLNTLNRIDGVLGTNETSS